MCMKDVALYRKPVPWCGAEEHKEKGEKNEKTFIKTLQD